MDLVRHRSAVGVGSAITAPLQSWLLKRRLDDGHAVALVPLIGPGTGGVALVVSGASL